MENSIDWEEDCKHYYGEVLTGRFGHWCDDWDGLPIDETCHEILCCTCFSDEMPEGLKEVQDKYRKELDEANLENPNIEL